MEKTENLQIPYIIPNQAQKHVTHNEAITALDALVQLSVESFGENAPPADPNIGSRYIIGSTPIGAWSGHENEVTAWQDGTWRFYKPKDGWVTIDAASETLLFFKNDGWVESSLANQLQNVDMVGINATADTSNRLAIASQSSLFSHDGNGHRVVINKAGESDTASVVFQNNFSGRAEFGITGSDLFALKVSNDGTDWMNALLVDPASGQIEMPNRPTAKATLGSGWVDSPAGTTTGFNGISINKGGFSLGTDVSNGIGKYLVVPTDGLYHVTIRVFAIAGSNFRMRLTTNNTANTLFFIETNESASKAFSQEANSIVQLNAGEQLCFVYNQFARCFHGTSHTELLINKV